MKLGTRVLVNTQAAQKYWKASGTITRLPTAVTPTVQVKLDHPARYGHGDGTGHAYFKWKELDEHPAEVHQRTAAQAAAARNRLLSELHALGTGLSPAPWHANDLGDIYAKNGKKVADEVFTGPDERLITQAPRLRELCVQLLETGQVTVTEQPSKDGETALNLLRELTRLKRLKKRDPAAYREEAATKRRVWRDAFALLDLDP